MQKITKDRLAGMNMNFNFYPFSYFLDAVTMAGLKNIEIWAGYPHLYSGYDSLLKVQQMASDIKSRELNVVNYTPEALIYPFNVASADKIVQAATLDFYKRNLEYASVLDCHNFLMIGGWGYYNQSIEDAEKRSVDMLSIISEYAGACGVTLLLEPLQYKESNIVIDLKSLQRMLHAVNSPYMKPMLDTVQMVSAGDTIDAYFDAFGQNLKHIHLTEGCPTGHLAWGDGNLPLKDFLHDIEKNDYQGFITLEVSSDATDPRPAFDRGLKYVEGTLASMDGH